MLMRLGFDQRLANAPPCAFMRVLVRFETRKPPVLRET